MRPSRSIRYYPRFPEAVPVEGAGCPRVTQPFATLVGARRPRFPFDLHVLGAPPAFILSQDRTLRSDTRHRGAAERPKRGPTRPMIRRSSDPQGNDRFARLAFILSQDRTLRSDTRHRGAAERPKRGPTRPMIRRSSDPQGNDRFARLPAGSPPPRGTILNGLSPRGPQRPRYPVLKVRRAGTTRRWVPRREK